MLFLLLLLLWSTASKLEILDASTNCTVQHWQLLQDTKLWLCNLSIVTLIELNGPLFGALSAPSTARLAMGTMEQARDARQRTGRDGKGCMSLSVHRLSWAKILNLANNHLSWSLAVKRMRVCGHDVSSNSNNSADSHSYTYTYSRTPPLTHRHPYTRSNSRVTVCQTDTPQSRQQKLFTFFSRFFVNSAQLQNVEAVFCVIVNRLFCMHAELYIINYSMSVHTYIYPNVYVSEYIIHVGWFRIAGKWATLWGVNLPPLFFLFFFIFYAPDLHNYCK